MAEREDAVQKVLDAIGTREGEPLEFIETLNGGVDGCPIGRRRDFDGRLAEDARAQFREPLR